MVGYAVRSPGFVSVANVQLLSRTSDALPSLVMAPSLAHPAYRQARLVPRQGARNMPALAQSSSHPDDATGRRRASVQACAGRLAPGLRDFTRVEGLRKGHASSDRAAGRPMRALPRASVDWLLLQSRTERRLRVRRRSRYSRGKTH